MALRQTNPGLLFGGKGCEVIAGGFRIDGTSNPNAKWDAGSNALYSVVRTSAGLFTVTLNKTYPREMVHGGAAIHLASNATAMFSAHIVKDSYSSSAGTFQIVTLVDSNGDGTYAADDPTDNSVITFFLVMQTQNSLVVSHGT
jgi:hypothetical protein